MEPTACPGRSVRSQPHNAPVSAVSRPGAQRSVGAPARAAEPAAAADPIQIEVGPEGVSVFAVASDAHALLTRLARDTGLRLIVDDSIRHTMTVNFVHKPVTEVLNNIVSAYGLSCREVNGIFIVSEGIPTSPSSYLLSDIEAIQTRYVLAPNAKSLLPVFLQDHVKTNAEQNAVILSAPPDVLKKFRQDISQFDIPAAQIMIDVLMVEFTDAGSRRIQLCAGTGGRRAPGLRQPQYRGNILPHAHGPPQRLPRRPALPRDRRQGPHPRQPSHRHRQRARGQHLHRQAALPQHPGGHRRKRSVRYAPGELHRCRASIST